MEKASRVMYSIANFFTWVLAFIWIAGIVFSALAIAHVYEPSVGEGLMQFGVASLILYIILLLVALFTIAMVRRAKAQGSSKGWDVLFLVLGIVGGNIFYFLGGLFGLIARR